MWDPDLWDREFCEAMILGLIGAVLAVAKIGWADAAAYALSLRAMWPTFKDFIETQAFLWDEIFHQTRELLELRRGSH